MIEANQNVFTFQSHTVRTALIDNEPWFVAVDVCRALGLSIIGGVRRHLGRMRPVEIKKIPREGSAHELRAEKGGNPHNLTVGVPLSFHQNESLLTILSESGLYKLIMRSDKPEAQEFQHWIASEVLPSIRKTGKYALADHGRNEMPMPAAFAEAFAAMAQDVNAMRFRTRQRPHPLGIEPAATAAPYGPDRAFRRMTTAPDRACWPGLRQTSIYHQKSMPWNFRTL